MNEKFEPDQAVEALQKAAKSVRAPKLDESILENATKVAAKPSLVERLGLHRKLAGFSLAGAAASVAVRLRLPREEGAAHAAVSELSAFANATFPAFVSGCGC